MNRRACCPIVAGGDGGWQYIEGAFDTLSLTIRKEDVKLVYLFVGQKASVLLSAEQDFLSVQHPFLAELDKQFRASRHAHSNGG